MSDPLNPYETPKTEPEEVTIQERDPLYVTYPMQSTRAMGMTCRVLLGLFGILCLLLAIWDLKLANEYDTTDEFEGLSFLSFEQMSQLESYYILLYIGAIFAVAFWKFRSMKNAWAIKKTGVQPTVSPGWAVAWYIIPIASLWKPYTAMREINLNSCEEPHKLNSWLIFWWLFWIAGTILTRTLNDSAEYAGVSDLRHSAVALFCMGAAGGCLERIIAYITASQMAEYDQSIISRL